LQPKAAFIPLYGQKGLAAGQKGTKNPLFCRKSAAKGLKVWLLAEKPSCGIF
jgi:hypothetical protein